MDAFVRHQSIHYHNDYISTIVPNIGVRPL